MIPLPVFWMYCSDATSAGRYAKIGTLHRHVFGNLRRDRITRRARARFGREKLAYVDKHGGIRLGVWNFAGSERTRDSHHRGQRQMFQSTTGHTSAECR